MDRMQNSSKSFIDPADPQSFERVLDVFAEVVELSPADRSARINELAGSDPPLMAAVLELIENADEADRAGFLDTTSGEDSQNVSVGGRSEEIPDWIGPFRVHRKIGEGGTGVVYSAESPPPLSRRVAVKLYKLGLSDKSAARSALEVEVLASFNHPGIAQVYETGVLDTGQRWTACELVPGSQISEYSSSCGWRVCVELLIQTAEAVHHAHQHGVIHRDLKPSNILVVQSDSSPRVKVIDFGVARILSPGSLAEAVTVPGLLVGTLAYMSPEQLGSEDIDVRTDVYGLGLVACEVLSGELPPGRTGGLVALTQSASSPLSVRLKGCGGHERDLEAIIEKATDPSPDLRYPSMQHLADDLRRVLDCEPIAARRSGPAHRLRLYVSRRPKTAIASLLIATIMLALATGLLVSRNQLADQVLDQRELTEELVTDTLRGLREIRGTIEQRQAMVSSLLDRNTRRYNQNPSDPDLTSLQARLLRERGDIEVSLGQYDRAEVDLKESKILYASLWKDGFGGSDIGRLYAESIIRVGDVLMERDRAKSIPEVMRQYQEALLIQEELLLEDPDNPGLLDDLCWSYDRIAGIGDKWGVIPESDVEAMLTKRAELSEELLNLDPERTLSLYNLGTAHLRLSRFFGARGRDDESAAAVDQGLPHIWAAVSAEPNRTMYVRTLISMLWWETNVLMKTGKVEQVPNAVERLVDIAQAQAHYLPGDVGTENIYISILAQAALTLEEIGQTNSAQVYAAEALERAQAFMTVVSPERLPEVEDKVERMRALLQRLQ